jgi:hypothetical protein
LPCLHRQERTEGGGVRWTEIKFPKQYKPIPNGFKVVWSELSEMFLGVHEEQDIESPVFCCKYMARRWCFARAEWDLLTVSMAYMTVNDLITDVGRANLPNTTDVVDFLKPIRSSLEEMTQLIGCTMQALEPNGEHVN